MLVNRSESQLLWAAGTGVLCGLACGHHSSNIYTVLKVGRYALISALLDFNL